MGPAWLIPVLLLVIATPASADIIQWRIPGVVTLVVFDPESDPSFLGDIAEAVPVGTNVVFDVAVDTRDSCALPDVGIYTLASFTAHVNGQTGSGSFGDPMLGAGVLTRPDAVLGGCIPNPIHPPGMRLISIVDDLPFFEVQIFWQDFPGDDVPVIPPVDASFWLGGTGRPAVVGLIEAESVTAIPEPSTLVLLLWGLAGALASRR